MASLAATVSVTSKQFSGHINQLKKAQDYSTHGFSYDKTGKSKITDIILQDADRNEVVVACYDWSDHLPYSDQLRISINSNEYADWLNIAYN